MIPRRFFILIDLAIVCFALVFSYALWETIHAIPLAWLPARARDVLSHGGTPLPQLRDVAWVLLIACPATIFFLGLVDAYRLLLGQSLTLLISSSLFAPIGSSALITLALFLLKRQEWSRLLVFLFTAVCAAGLFAARASLCWYLRIRRDAGFYAKNVLLIGKAGVVAWLAEYFRSNVLDSEYRIFGYLSPDASRCSDDSIPLRGEVRQLADLLIRQPVHEVIAVTGADDGGWISSVIEDCDMMGVVLRIVPETLLFGTRRNLRTLYPFELLNLPAVVLMPRYLDADALFFKRVFDLVISAVSLILSLPLFVLVAIAIKITTPGIPVFYRWKVVGRNGVRFTGYKFTTMYPDADVRRKELLEKNEMTGPVFKIKNDPRVTPLGRFLRKFSINELPQLWSVLKGDMSLVGPRPAFPHELDGYGFWHKRKLSIRPGITCLWQVRGRNKISNFDDWVKMDLEYIDNWSLWLDFKILARTAWVVVAGTGS
jgi:exopolysaccharide biosynthesis polyprenyl glycosylphosphotransferase